MDNAGEKVEPASPKRDLHGPIVLHEGYYLDNFLFLLDFVESRYADLLAPPEQAFLDDFRALDQAAQRLWVRLISRRGPCFRVDRLSYPEIGPLAEPITRLSESGFLDRAEVAALSDWLALFPVKELADLLGQRTSLARPKLLELAADHNEVTLRAAIRERVDLVQPRRVELLLVFRLLFFGNLHQDLSEFVIRDLGLMRYETYELSRDFRLFVDRQALEHALEFRLLHQEIAQRLESGDFESARTVAQGLIERDVHPVARRQLDRILNSVAREAERQNELTLAQLLYLRAELPPARERLARLAALSGEVEKALDICREMAKAPRDETEAIFAESFPARLAKQKTPASPSWPTLELVIDKPAPGITVEAAALEALESVSRPGIYAENWLWRSLFGLAFWDIVFAPVTGAFHHPFQLGPSDLNAPDFRGRRAQALATRLDELRTTTDLGLQLLAVYDRKVGTANALVSWHDGSRAQIAQALKWVDGAALALICDRLTRDFGRYRRGLPDLLVATETGFELWEVKGPDDQLRPEQVAWLRFFADSGIKAGVLKVRWAQNDD